MFEIVEKLVKEKISFFKIAEITFPVMIMDYSKLMESVGLVVSYCE